MFTVKNKLIQQQDKTIDIGQERKITLSFMFEDEEFLDDDTFMLLLGTAVGDVYAFKNDGFLSFRNLDLSEIITSASETFSVKAYVGEDEILDDELTITAIANGQQDLSDYVTSSNLTNTLSSYYTKTQTDSLFNNELKINTITDDTDTIALSYDTNYDVIEVDNTTNTSSITINPCTNYTAVSGKIPTFEIWIKPTTTKTTITVSNSIKIVGEMPTELEAGSIHCFVFRFVGSDQLLNYSYTFEPTITIGE